MNNLFPPQNQRSRQRGFTLIEITIVIMIIGAILGLALSRTTFNKVDNRKVFRDITIAVKEIRNRSKLYSTTYRLAIRLDPKDQSYWLEKASSPTLLNKDDLKKEREQSQKTFQDDKDKVPALFQPDKSLFKKEQSLPKGYSFKSLESGPQELTFTEGIAYIYFFPQGLIENVALHIEDPKKNIWTLVFNPLTGQADIIDGEKSLNDMSR